MKRRVTVHFGDVRVVVPCQDENTTVGDLAEAAILRYKKATGKNHYDFDEASIGFHLYATAGLLDFWHFPAALLIVSWLSSSL
ncbi:unnamed protein product [Heligmosomoides polygyrus]|uniref:Par3_HAL_N_term domain-containing protein n=1 Tax=Heligmosomoides polygyrus TaxID=6339 RepID=A0A3P7YN20_HELPZ|nr:unnamed protein product [Heligmosomoides polygyrus]